MMYSSLGRQLRLTRKRRNLTQVEAARLIGCSLRTYKSWELEGTAPLGVWGLPIRGFCRQGAA